MIFTAETQSSQGFIIDKVSALQGMLLPTTQIYSVRDSA